MQKIQINREHDGKRLDIALSFQFGSITRTNIKKIIESNKLLVNGEVEFRANRRVKEGDIVEFESELEEEKEKIIPENIDLEIIYEDEDLLAINKPAGMVVHPATGNWSGTVMNALMYHYRNLKSVGERVRSGLIHRLDKDTSGLLLIGKTNKGLWHYSKQFSTRKVKKQYIACVKSRSLDKDYENMSTFEVRNYMGRNKLNRKKMMVVGDIDTKINLPSDARISHTVFNVLSEYDDKKLFSVFPKTGRTHQIRVHCAHIGCPIIGDKVYGGITNQRMLLHALSLEIRGINGELLRIKANPDDEFVSDLVKYKLDYTKI